jgi:hypothetical protein
VSSKSTKINFESYINLEILKKTHCKYSHGVAFHGRLFHPPQPSTHPEPRVKTGSPKISVIVLSDLDYH